MAVKHITLLYLTLILSAGTALRLHGFLERSLGTDESISLFLASGRGMEVKEFTEKTASSDGVPHCTAKDLKVFFKADKDISFGEYTRGLARLDPHPPLYLWIIFFLMRLFTDGLPAVRGFSLLMGLLAVYLSYLLTKEMFGRQAGVFASLFLSISALAVRYSQEARSYSLVLVLGLLAWLFAVRFEKHGTARDVLLFSLFNCLGIYAHYFYVFPAVGFFLYFTLAHGKNRRLLDGFYAAFLLSLAGLLPWVSVVSGTGYRFDLVEWIFAYPGILDKIGGFFTGASGLLFIFPSSYAVQAAGSLLLLLLMFYAGKKLLKEQPGQLYFCLCVLLAPLLGMLALDLLQGGLMLRQARFWIFPLLGTIPLAGYSLSRLFRGKRAVVYLLCALMLVSAFFAGGKQTGPAPRRISGWINSESEGKTAAVIMYNIRTVTMPQAFYLDDSVLVFPVSNREQFKAALDRAAALSGRVFVIRHLHHADPSLMDRQFMHREPAAGRLRMKERLLLDNIEVEEYERTA